jgi:hypothetical protein
MGTTGEILLAGGKRYSIEKVLADRTATDETGIHRLHRMDGPPRSRWRGSCVIGDAGSIDGDRTSENSFYEAAGFEENQVPVDGHLGDIELLDYLLERNHSFGIDQGKEFIPPTGCFHGYLIPTLSKITFPCFSVTVP